MRHQNLPTRRHVIAGASLLGAPAWAADTPNSAFLGVWTGALRAGGVTLRLRLTIDSPTAATLVSLDEGGDARAASKVVLTNDAVDIRFAGVFASFKGRLIGQRLVGRWRQMLNDLPLTLERADAAAPLPPLQADRLTPALLAQWRSKAQVPAMGAAACRAGGQCLTIVDGRRSARADTPVAAGDRWHWGSITKSMTATLVARHVERGALSWDDTVGHVLGGRIGDIRSDYAAVTLLELLSHRSGLAANLATNDRDAFSRSRTASPKERLAYAAAALRQRPAARRRDDYSYSNNGYVVAAAMLEARLGEVWEDLIARDLFAPLGLGTAGFGAPGRADRLDHPLGHYEPAWNWRDGRPRDPAVIGGKHATDNVVALGPAGRVHMSLSDMLVYLAAHRDLQPGLLSKASWERLHTPPFGGEYALGWMRQPGGGLWHNGSNTLWYAEVQVDHTAGVVAAAVANDAVEDVTLPLVARVLKSAAAAA